VGGAVGVPEVLVVGELVGAAVGDVEVTPPGVEEEPGRALVVTGPLSPLPEVDVEEMGVETLELGRFVVVVTVETMVVVIYVLWMYVVGALSIVRVSPLPYMLTICEADWKKAL
jgi:hypothetical protein